MAQTRYRSLKDLLGEEYVVPGTPLCSGCGALLTFRLFHKALGKKVVWVNAAGCITLMIVYPFSPLKSSWMYTAMGCAPAGAQGIRDALDILIEKGEVDPEEDLKVVVVTGDGAANDIGLQSASGAIHRRLDFYYLCYDNEAFGNTGFQFSPSTPYGSKTMTSLPTPLIPEGHKGRKKDLFEIWRAHNPPYLATVSPSHPMDMMRKIEKAERFKGPKLFISISPCPPGWGYDTMKTIRMARLAVETGVWPLKEAVHGEVRHTFIPRSLKPLEEYLKEQERFKHLFYPLRREDIIGRMQREVEEYWRKVYSTEVLEEKKD
ncbi:MAG: thiamine pyrophosphate-dependent enzyme [Aigarchaeota archaeon]|nr:thiamine pyrophosphate-dependent enzyme [Aigarchaeota archaeon]MCX8193176.1 thiamine pyrophosphate-dependent enzyme [Nitrososphaeria archaeon]MDW7986317.1 thiamine pyrophosphate-dependent enzyme [Nitrososphaerota archaeon]